LGKLLDYITKLPRNKLSHETQITAHNHSIKTYILWPLHDLVFSFVNFSISCLAINVPISVNPQVCITVTPTYNFNSPFCGLSRRWNFQGSNKSEQLDQVPNPQTGSPLWRFKMLRLCFRIFTFSIFQKFKF
jgi:hypothetical protein